MTTIEQAQEERKKGNWLVANRKFTTVLYLGQDKEKALKIYKEKRNKRGGACIYAPLVKVWKTMQEKMRDINEAEQMYKQGLMCNI